MAGPSIERRGEETSPAPDGQRIVTDHSALEDAVDEGKTDRAVEKVLRGERH